jgi:hypothetical protein
VLNGNQSVPFEFRYKQVFHLRLFEELKAKVTKYRAMKTYTGLET